MKNSINGAKPRCKCSIFLQIDFRNGNLRKKYDTLKYVLKNIEVSAEGRHARQHFQHFRASASLCGWVADRVQALYSIGVYIFVPFTGT